MCEKNDIKGVYFYVPFMFRYSLVETVVSPMYICPWQGMKYMPALILKLDLGLWIISLIVEEVISDISTSIWFSFFIYGVVSYHFYQ